jgi:hypothetical protein
MDAVGRFREDPNTHFSETTFKDDMHAVTTLEFLCSRWFASQIRYDWLYGVEPPVLKLEQEFDVPLFDVPLSDGTEVPVWLTGTADVIEVGAGVHDWKFADQEYIQWEKQRWAIQPTVYTYAAVSNGWVKPDRNGRVPFTYHIYPRDPKVKPYSIPVWRDESHWNWLCEQIEPLVRAVMDDRDPEYQMAWQKNDQSWKCSEKWCPWFNECKGKVISDDWTQTIKKPRNT